MLRRVGSGAAEEGPAGDSLSVVPQLNDLLDRQIVFFGGKGGVGKTTLAAAFAIHSAERGMRTLLVSTDTAHSTSDILQTVLGAEPRRVTGECWALEIDPGHETDRYIGDVKRRIAGTIAPRLMQEVERQIDIARVSPGAEEAAVFERFARIIEEFGDDFSRIFFDTAPTGQTLRLLSLPELMTTWINGLIGRRKKVNMLARMWRNVAGVSASETLAEDDPVLSALEERRDRFVRTREILTDSHQSAFVFVLTPEWLPLLETRKAVGVLSRYRIPVAAILINRVLPLDADGEFLERRRQREAEYLGRIDEAFTGFPICKIPLNDRDVVGLQALREMAATAYV